MSHIIGYVFVCQDEPIPGIPSIRIYTDEHGDLFQTWQEAITAGQDVPNYHGMLAVRSSQAAKYEK